MLVRIELMNLERVILEEINTKAFKQKDIAQTYSFVIKQNYPIDIKKINKAIVNRWSLSGLNTIKKLAWKIVDNK